MDSCTVVETLLPHLLTPIMHTICSFCQTNTCPLCSLSVWIPTCGETETPQRRTCSCPGPDLTWAPAVRSARCVHWWWTPRSCHLSTSCRSSRCWQPSLCGRKKEGYSSGVNHSSWRREQVTDWEQHTEEHRHLVFNAPEFPEISSVCLR